MKFSCDRCQTRYSIGDDKVKGKVLKIRCKTCGNIVVVREQLPTVQGEASGFATPQVASNGGTGSINVQPNMVASSSTGVTTAARPEIDWYVAIKGKQHGPAKHDEVVRLFRDGRITDRTYLWHDQLPSWVRLKDLPEFAAAVAEGPGPRKPPPPPADEGAEIVNFEAARAQRQTSASPTTPQASTSLSFLTGPQVAVTPSNNATNDPFAALPSGPGGGPEAPRESTRVFIMQAGLHNRSSKHKLYAGVAAATVIGVIALCVIDYQLDILGLKRVVDAVAVTTGIKQQPVEPVEGGWEDEEGDPTLKCQFAPDAADCIKKARARIAENAKRRARAGGGSGAGTGAALSDDELKNAFGTNTGAGTEPAPSTKTTIGSDGFVGVGGGGLAMDTSGLGKRQGPSAPQVKIDLPSTEGTSIDAANAAKVVRDGQGAIQVCVDSAMKNNEDIPQKIRMTLSIGLKGSVERAVINNAVVQASGLGTCLTGSARKWKFAPPTEPADLEIPLVLR
ncbi:MAG TPA: GYF domain-containing protein [Myxococcota bacterium]